MQKQQLSESEVLEKLRSYCAYRERCSFEVESRAKELGLASEKMEATLSQLEKDNFLNDRRFAELYARSKFRQNAWGRFKIREGLYSKRLSKADVEQAVAKLDQAAYAKQVKELTEKFNAQGYSADRIFQKMKAKGYEGDMVYSLMQEMRLV